MIAQDHERDGFKPVWHLWYVVRELQSNLSWHPIAEPVEGSLHPHRAVPDAASGSSDFKPLNNADQFDCLGPLSHLISNVVRVVFG